MRQSLEEFAAIMRARNAGRKDAKEAKLSEHRRRMAERRIAAKLKRHNKTAQQARKAELAHIEREKCGCRACRYASPLWRQWREMERIRDVLCGPNGNLQSSWQMLIEATLREE